MFQGTINVFRPFSLLIDEGIGVCSIPSFLLKADIYYTPGFKTNVGVLFNWFVESVFCYLILVVLSQKVFLETLVSDARVLFSDRFWLIATDFILEFEEN